MRLLKSPLFCTAVVFVLGLTSCSTFFPSRAYDDAGLELRQSIDAILADSIFIPARVGIKVVSMSDGRVLYERDSRALFHPASNLKLLTSATALHALGKDYKFKTALYADSLSEDGEIIENLYLKGFGNPDLKVRDLHWMVEQLRAKGVKTVHGDVVGDVSFFDDLFWGNGWMWDDEPSFYEAFITPLSINDNSVRVLVAAGEKIGDPVHVRLDPETKYLSVANHGLTSPDATENTIEVTRDFKERSNTIIVKGALPHNAKEREFVLSVWRPELYAVTLLREELEREGIAVEGTTHLGAMNGEAKQLVLHEWPIDPVVINLNKSSDNLSAENTLKVIAAERRGIPGTSRAGISVVNEFLSSLGIDTTSYLMVDGSGVSHYNLISAETTARLLTAMFTEKSTRARFDLFYASLPIAGVDGTLGNRMKGTAAEGMIRAKTGTISGVSSLSGYAKTRDGGFLAFSMMMQHFVGSSKPYRDAQDKIAELLSQFRYGPSTASR